MVAKIIIKDQPLIDVYPMGDTLEEIREILPIMGYEKPGLHYLDIQPGVGKTHAVTELLKGKASYIVVTGTHKLLKGEYEKLRAQHWKSFDAKCEKYDNVKKLHSLKVPIRLICDLQGCNKTNCPYWKQFNTPKAIAPYHILQTNRVKEEKDFKFDMLVLDETMRGYNCISADISELKEIIEVISKYSSTFILSEMIRCMEDGGEFFDFIKNNKKEITKTKYTALKKAINNKEWDDVKTISSLNVFELLKFSYYHSIHEEISTYNEPNFYEILDLARQDIPIILLDASFDEKLFRLIIGRYAYEDSKQPRSLLLGKELKPLKDVKINLYQSKLKQKDRKIYRMDKDNYYYKTNLIRGNGLTAYGKETINKLRTLIKITKRKYSKVGIITYKDLAPNFVDLGKTDYFFNLRGSNELENTEALIIIGTPQTNPEETVNEYNKLTMTKINPREGVYKHKYVRKDGEFLVKDGLTGENHIRVVGGGKEKVPFPIMRKDSNEGDRLVTYHRQFEEGEMDLDIYYPLHDHDEKKSNSEQYQAIHRSRSLINQKEVYVFGNVPEQIKKEFNVIQLDKKRTNAFFKGTRGIYPLSLWALITDIYREKELKSEELAKKLRIYKTDKNGYNTSFITAIIKGEVSLEDIMKIDRSIKENPEITAGAIKRKYRTLGASEEFVEYCVFYAKNGGFIRNG
jgi:hypothetical protein